MHSGALLRGSRAWVGVGTLAWEARVGARGAGKGNRFYQQVMGGHRGSVTLWTCVGPCPQSTLEPCSPS